MVNASGDASDQSPSEEEPVAAEGDADWIATHGGERPAVAEAPAEDQASPDPSTDPESKPEADESEPAKKTAKKSRGRASVPSWDEIMFGGERRE